jgi:hypothetical protein
MYISSIKIKLNLPVIRFTQLKIKTKELTILDHLKHIHICHCF